MAMALRLPAWQWRRIGWFLSVTRLECNFDLIDGEVDGFGQVARIEFSGGAERR